MPSFVDNQTVSGQHKYSYTTNTLNQYTAVGDVNYLYDDNGNMTYDGANSYAYDAQNRLVTVTKAPDALAVACDNVDLVFTTGGDASWFAQTAVYYYDNDAAQSGPIGDNQETWLQTTVEGTGILQFYWKDSCDVNDGFAFYVDDQYIMGRQDSADWQEFPHDITTSGTHTFKWRYHKDAGGTSGVGCGWVDYVRWSGSVPDPNGWQTITYTYDPAGRRIAKAVDGTTAVKYLYDGDHCIAEYDGSDNLLRKYIFGPCIDEPISMIDVEDSNATYYYHFDALGSVVALTNSSGSTVELYEYSVYGQVAASDANIPNRFMFTGREFDADTGLYYYRARYYNPEIGRFLQTDPIGYEGGMNLYRYCGNNSLNETDPYGLDGSGPQPSYTRKLVDAWIIPVPYPWSPWGTGWITSRTVPMVPVPPISRPVRCYEYRVRSQTRKLYLVQKWEITRVDTEGTNTTTTVTYETTQNLIKTEHRMQTESRCIVYFRIKWPWTRGRGRPSAYILYNRVSDPSPWE